jgi:hypothetical protein
MACAHVVVWMFILEKMLQREIRCISRGSTAAVEFVCRHRLESLRQYDLSRGIGPTAKPERPIVRCSDNEKNALRS